MTQPIATFDPAAATGAQRRTIARHAKRRIGAEVRLILSAGFSVSFVGMFVLGGPLVIRLSLSLLIHPTVIMIVCAALVSAVWAAVHYRVGSLRIACAKAQQIALYRFDEETRRASVAQRMASLGHASQRSGQRFEGE